MARFNDKSQTIPQRTTNKAGGHVFQKGAEQELASRLLTWFVNDGYYTSTQESMNELNALVKQCDPKFVAKAAIYARTVYGMRSVTHVVANMLFDSNISGEKWARNFANKVVYRVDDMTEILSLWLKTHDKIPNAMKAGFRDAFDKFDNYQLGKYQAKGKQVSLVDLIRLVHPKPKVKNSHALTQAILGILKAEGTRQSALVQATQGIPEADRAKARNQVWHDTIESMGLFELVKNLNGLLRDAPELYNVAIEKLSDVEAIKRSKILPFRFFTAYENVGAGCRSIQRELRGALAGALQVACTHVPKLDNTLVVLDVSGSMSTPMRETRGNSDYVTTMKRGGAVMAAIATSASNADLMVFATDAKYVVYTAGDSVMQIAEKLSEVDGCNGHSTEFNSIFGCADHAYDRIIIFSDMQGWYIDEGFHHKELNALNRYKNFYDADPIIYSVNLAEHGGSMFNPANKKMVGLAGFSEKLFDLIAEYERGTDPLIKAIQAIEL